MRRIGVLLLLAFAATSCGLIEDLTQPSEWEPLDVETAVLAGRTTEPAGFRTPSEGHQSYGWPADVPIASFINVPSHGRSERGGRFRVRLDSDRQVSPEAISGYVARLLVEGFEIDPRTRHAIWLVRDDREWVGVFNSPNHDLTMAAGVRTVYTNAPTVESWCVGFTAAPECR